MQVTTVGSSPISKQQPVITGTISMLTTTTTSVVTTCTTTSHRDIVTTPAVGRNHSPRGHSPTRERDSYRFDLFFINVLSAHS